MNTTTKRVRGPLAFLAVILVLGGVPARTSADIEVTYVGAEVSSTSSGGWGTSWNSGWKKDFRSTNSSTKLFPLPGTPNAYGADGYIMFGQSDALAQQETSGDYKGTIYTGTRSGQTFSNPVLGIASVAILNNTGDGQWSISPDWGGQLDDASLGIGASVADLVNGALFYRWDSGETEHALLRITLNGSLSVSTIRIGVLTDRGDSQKPDAIGLNGVWQPRLGTSGYSLPDWYFFDITNAGAGDIVTISIRRWGSVWGTNLRGLVFDVKLAPKGTVLTIR